MATFSLTTGKDTFVGGPDDDTVTATSATLTGQDIVIGGAGTDVLALYSYSGRIYGNDNIFNVDQLPISGFENITLNGDDDLEVYLGSQTIAVKGYGPGYEFLHL